MPRFKDQAICIRLIDWSETSQVVALLTEQHGKLRGVAKGSKRMSPSSIARFSGGIELLTLGQVVATTKATAELATITEWDLQQPFRHLRTDLEAHRLGLYAVDLANAMLADHDPHPVVFTALARVLEEVADASRRAAALLQYQWDVLADCGYRPELERDVRTAAALPLEAPLAFDPHRGGVTAAAGIASQAPSDAGPWRVRGETIELLRALGRGESTQSNPAEPGAPAMQDVKTIERANQLLCAYVRAILDRPLPTMGFVLG